MEMDWNAAIEKNREALKRILAMLVAMAEMGTGGQFTFFRRKGGDGPEVARAEKSKLSPELTPAPTLPRRLHRAVLSLLRPAEAAARRLIIVAARGLVVALPPPRLRKPKPKTTEPLLRRFGIAIIMSPADLAREAAARRAAAIRAARPRALCLPLLDPLRCPLSLSKGRFHRRHAPAHAAPRILFPGVTEPFPLPAPPSPRDPVDAARLVLRLEALGRALDDLPGQAKRFARWKARGADALAQRRAHDAAGGQNGDAGGAAVQKKEVGKAGRFVRVWPLRPGRPPGWRRKPVHEVHEVLDVVHGLAFWALEPPDTS
jgi:hypothetical protein